MKDKLVQNKNIIILVAEIVAAALLVPGFISLLGNQVNDSAVFNFIQYGLYIATSLLLIFYVVTKKEITLKALIAPLILFVAAQMVNNVYNLILNNSWSSIFYLALYASVLITFIIYVMKPAKNLKYAVMILFLVCIAFNLSGLFNGSLIDFSRLITNLIFCSILYLEKGGNE